MFVDDIKKAARISHNKLDSDVQRLEDYAKAEMLRLGIPAHVVNDASNDLIRNAIVTYALSEIGKEKSQDRAREAWLYQLDCLRKTGWPSE